MRTRAARLRLLGLVLSVAIASALVWVVIDGDLDTVQSAVESTGAWGPVAYVALHVLLTLVPVSKNLLAGVAGALFGLAGGIALSWVGAMVSAVVTFAIARRLGRAAVASMTGPRIDRVEEIMRQQGLLAVIIARVTPVIPFTVVNYGAGVTAVSTRDFVLGTAIGIVPGTVGYAALGASAGRDATTFVIAGIFAVALFAGSLLLGWRAARRQQRSAQ